MSRGLAIGQGCDSKFVTSSGVVKVREPQRAISRSEEVRFFDCLSRGAAPTEQRACLPSEYSSRVGHILNNQEPGAGP